MCEAGVNMKAMQEILGHADAETTMDIYAEATKDLKRTEMIGFAEFFEKLSEAQKNGAWAYDQLTTDLRPLIKIYGDLRKTAISETVVA